MDIYHLLKRATRWWWLILVSAVIAGGISYYVSLQQPPVYQASTTLIVGQVMQRANPSISDFETASQIAQSYAEIARRQPVLQATVESLGLQFGWQELQGQVFIEQLPQTQLLEIRVWNSSPELAMLISDELARQLILQSPSDPDDPVRQERGSFIQTQLDELEARINKARLSIREKDRQLDAALSATEIQGLQAEISELESLLSSWQANYTELLNFLEGAGDPNFLAIIEPAQWPGAPIGPARTINVLLAAVVGAGLAFGAAILLEYMDNTIRVPADMKEGHGVRVLGTVTRVRGKGYENKLLTAGGPFSPLAEDYRRLRSSIKAIDRPTRSILITSANPNSGKSVTAANLALVMAQAELKTILVDADLRRPSVHKIFQMSNVEGLTDLFRSPTMAVEDRLQKTDFANLQIITSGALPGNPTEMLGSKRMFGLLRQLEELADVVILDSPPVLPLADAVDLATQVDGVIQVVYAGRTRRPVFGEAVEILREVGANILGAVLNGVVTRQRDYYYHYYHSASNGRMPTSKMIGTGQRRKFERFPFVKR